MKVFVGFLEYKKSRLFALEFYWSFLILSLAKPRTTLTVQAVNFNFQLFASFKYLLYK